MNQTEFDDESDQESGVATEVAICYTVYPPVYYPVPVTGQSLPSLVSGTVALGVVAVWMTSAIWHRRWPRFTLRTAFIVVTLTGCWLGWELKSISNRSAAIELIRKRGGEVIVGDPASLPLVRRLLGDRAISYIHPDAALKKATAEIFSPGEIERIESLLPEAAWQPDPAPKDPAAPSA